jgi:hypothetical protein
MTRADIPEKLTMNVRQILLVLVAAVGISTPAEAAPELATARPNILWITCEDMSPD